MEKIGSYEILSAFKQTGSGTVYRVFDPVLKESLALKVVRHSDITPAILKIFTDQMAGLKKLSHSNILPVMDAREFDGKPGYTMKIAARGSLSDHLSRFHSDPRALAKLISTVARAVQYAHDQQLIHGNLKPANILLDDGDRPLVSDFGLPIQAELSSRDDTNPGSLPYMPPEQFQGYEQHTSRIDIWALGVILYEVVTGQKPFLANDRSHYWHEISGSEPARPSVLVKDLDPYLEMIILRCLKKDPARRYQTAAQLADDLDRWLEGNPPREYRLPLGKRLTFWVVKPFNVLLLISGLLALAFFSLFVFFLAGKLIPTLLKK